YHGNRTVIESAADYMVSVQLTTGGWENYVGSSSGENNEVTGEALWGIRVAYAPPTTPGYLDCAANKFGTRFRSFGSAPVGEQYIGKDNLGDAPNRNEQTLSWSAGTHHILFSYDAVNNVFTSQVTMDGTPPVPQTALTWTPATPPAALDYIQFDVVKRDAGTTVNLNNIVLTIGATDYYIADLTGSGWPWSYYLSGYYLAGGFSLEADLEIAGTFPTPGGQENSKVEISVCGAPNVALGACPILLNVANPTADVDVNYLGGASDDIFGYSVYFSYPDDVLDITSITPTDWLKGTGASYTSTTFNWKEFDQTGDNVVRVDASRLNQFLGGVGDPGTMFTVHFAPATGVDCGNGDLVIDPDPVNYPMKFRNAYNADITASIVAGDCHIELDVLAPVVQNTLIENLIVHPITGSHEYAKDTDNLKMRADVSDNCLTPTASMILADLSTLLSTGGTAVPADDYTSGVATWNLNNVTLTADGLKTVTITVTDLLNNTTTDSDDITVDNTDPMPATDLYAHPGHKKVNLEWTAGTDDNLYGYAVKTLQTNNVDGNEYPFYVPPMPTNPTAPVPADYPPVAAATDWVTNAFVSEPAATLTHAIVPRGVNYYTIYTFDWALNMAQTASSERATNYYLGDVGSGSGPLPGSGGFNGRIGGYDLTWFSTNYWWTDGTPDVRDEEEYHGDIGPTEASVRTYADDHRFGIPVPDGQIEFEDLMIFSMNYDNVAPKMPTPINVEIHKEFALRLVEERIGSDLTLFVRVENDGTPLKGASLLLQYDPTVLQVKGVDNGSLFGAADLQAFYAHRAGDGLVRFDAALLGNGRTVAYSGDLAVLHFTLMDRDANTDLLFGSVKMRDGGNQDIALRLKGAGSSMPEGYVLSQNYPNPFNPTTVIEYQIVEPGRVTIEVYNMLGARVATVVDGMHDAGSYQALLNATALPSGLYYYTMRAGSFTATRSMTLTK
ncbi:MAG: T9SS type A sorting domain-containing protein, partial [Bacteroidetes bacterium]|nr:T9SS type A sorting domain-containing protein [Bacteroidota bacterium]